MLDGGDHATGFEVFVGEHIPAIEHRAAGHSGLAQHAHHLELVPLPGPGRDDVEDLIEVCVAVALVGKAWIGQQLGPASHIQPGNMIKCLGKSGRASFLAVKGELREGAKMRLFPGICHRHELGCGIRRGKLGGAAARL